MHSSHGYACTTRGMAMNMHANTSRPRARSIDAPSTKIAQKGTGVNKVRDGHKHDGKQTNTAFARHVRPETCLFQQLRAVYVLLVTMGLVVAVISTLGTTSDTYMSRNHTTGCRSPCSTQHALLPAIPLRFPDATRRSRNDRIGIQSIPAYKVAFALSRTIPFAPPRNASSSSAPLTVTPRRGNLGCKGTVTAPHLCNSTTQVQTLRSVQHKDGQYGTHAASSTQVHLYIV